MPAFGVIETSGRGRAVPPCPICGGDDHVESDSYVLHVGHLDGERLHLHRD